MRAAFKAGVTPTRIARQFGLSQADVRKVLSSDETEAMRPRSGPSKPINAISIMALNTIPASHHIIRFFLRPSGSRR